MDANQIVVMLYLFVTLTLIFGGFLILILIMFGKLFWTQFKLWFLAKRGFHLVEWIGEDKIRRYFLLRPSENKFDLAGGYYIYIPETTTRKGKLIEKPDINPLNKTIIQIDKLENEQRKEAINTIKDLNYDRRGVSLGWGIPIITYYGDNPEPVFFEDRKKVYGSGVIKDVYLRLLLTQKYGWFKKMSIMFMVLLGAIAITLLLLYLGYKSQIGNNQMCLNIVNHTAQALIDFTNRTIANMPPRIPTNITI